MKPKVRVSKKYKKALKGSSIPSLKDTSAKLRKEYQEFNRMPAIGVKIGRKLKKARKKAKPAIKKFKKRSNQISRNIDDYFVSQLKF